MSLLKNLQHLMKSRILLMDGAMGTMIQRYKLSEEDFRGARFKNHPKDQKGNNDLLSLTRPDIIAEIHKAYLDAGADIIETNTFSSTSIAMADYAMEDQVYDLNYYSAKLAKAEAEKASALTPNKPRYVAGALGPTNRTASISPDVNDPGFRAVDFDTLKNAYYQQIKGLIDGGVDILLIETVFDTLNCKAALFAIESFYEDCGWSEEQKLPIMISGTITDASGRTLSGQTVEAFYISVTHLPLLSIGLNCALGAELMEPFLKELSRISEIPVSAYPNAGLPNAFGAYDESPSQMAVLVKKFIDQNLLNIVGGCCGTTPDHIKELSKIIENIAPRTWGKKDDFLKLSGLEPFVVFPGSNFVNIGERTNVTGSRKFARLIREGLFDEALSVARQQVEGGAQVLDVNMDEGMLDSVASMKKFLNLLAAEPDIARIPIMVDSSKWTVIEEGLKCLQGKGIVNSISLKEGEEPFLAQARLLRKYGAAVVVMAFDEQGQADSLERRKAICKRCYELLTNIVGFPAHDIIFDPNIFAIATGIEEHNTYAIDFIEACRWIKENLPHAKVSGGVSNISFSFRGNEVVREAMHSAFLYHAIRAGMDMGIVNAGLMQVYDDIPSDLLKAVEDALFNTHPEATEALVEVAERYKGEGGVQLKEKNDAWRSYIAKDRLIHALIHGIVDFIEEDTLEALKEFDHPLGLIEGPLMEGMNVVGDRFGAGKMFLPQVVKSARVMKKSVSIITPILEQVQKSQSREASKQGKVLLATVKGDVHDIGKNIVGVVLACNNYDVLDLGVMVPAEKILQTALEEKVDIIGLSGLITPSLDEMVYIADEMQKRAMSLPLLIGGATTSKIHTAVKIDPKYTSEVVHVMDASKAVPVVSKLLNPTSRELFIKEIKEEYQSMREDHLSRMQEKNYRTLKEAQAAKYSIDWKSTKISKPNTIGVQVFDSIDLKELVPYIDWSPFFWTWELKGAFPKILEHNTYGDVAKKLYEDALIILDELIEKKWLTAKAVIGIFPANSVEDDIEVYADENRNVVVEKLFNLRQQHTDERATNALCLSDFIAPKESGIADYIGGFAVTTGLGAEKMESYFHNDQDDYNGILFKALADRLAEALAEYMHEKVRKELWGYASDEVLSKEDFIKERYVGIRPAPGYPANPDHTEKLTLFRLLDVESQIGMQLTESLAMLPAASVSGWYYAHPEAKYFGIQRIDKDQVLSYAERKGWSIEEAERWLRPILAY